MNFMLSRERAGINPAPTVGAYGRRPRNTYIRTMAGMTGTKGKLLKALMEEKVKEREL